MKRNQSFELLKFVAVFFVVVIHSRFNSYFGASVDAIIRFSLPIFFMITGYYIVQSDYIASKLKKQAMKLTKYYLLYEVVYITYYFINAILTNKIQQFGNSFLNNLKFILIAPTIGYHLWYVINIIWVLLIIYIFNSIDKLNTLFIISAILHLGGIFISHLSVYIFHHKLEIYFTRNFLFFGLFYVLLGSYFRKVNINKIKFNNKFILGLSVLACLSQVVEKYLWFKLFDSHFSDYFITTILASILIFVYTLRGNVNNRTIEKISSYSMPIYFLHPLTIDILFKMHINVIKNTIIGNFIFIIIVCILSCILYDLAKKVVKTILNRTIKFQKKTQVKI